MPSKHVRLSDKAARVLTAIAQGHTYEQILARDRTLAYLDIFAAAREALAVAAQPAGDGDAGVADSAKKPGKRTHERTRGGTMTPRERSLLELEGLGRRPGRASTPRRT